MLKLNRSKFFAEIRNQFSDLNQSQVSGLTDILDYLEVDPRISDPKHAAYMLATTRHETFDPHTKSAYHPITEIGPKSYFTKYDGRADLGNNQPGDGYRFRGRGYVQTTGRKNFTKLGKEFSKQHDQPIDFASAPDLLLQPEYAYFAMSYCMTVGMYTGKKLSDYINVGKCDYVNARRIINGTDKADKIAEYARKIEAAIISALTVSPELPLISHDAIIIPPNQAEHYSPLDASTLTEVKGTLVISDKIKEIASTGLTSIGNRITSGSVTLGTLAAAQAFLKQNWMFLAFAAFLILVGLGIWVFLYHTKHKEKLIQAEINADKSKHDVEFK